MNVGTRVPVVSIPIQSCQPNQCLPMVAMVICCFIDASYKCIGKNVYVKFTFFGCFNQLFQSPPMSHVCTYRYSIWCIYTVCSSDKVANASFVNRIKITMISPAAEIKRHPVVSISDCCSRLFKIVRFIILTDIQALNIAANYSTCLELHSYSRAQGPLVLSKGHFY